MPIRRDIQDESPDTLQAFSGEHLYYEMSMFLICAGALTQQMELGFAKNLLMEGYVMHLRALMEFFIKREAASDRDKDDVYAVDFAVGWQKPKLSDDAELARTRANKEVGHITTYRKDPNDKSKYWDSLIGTVTPEIRGWCERFVREADPNKLHPKIKELLRDTQILRIGNAVEVRDSTTTTMTMKIGSTTATFIKGKVLPSNSD